jgi:hypothetical protein
MIANDGGRLARLSTVVSGRMSSSWSRITAPLISRTGTTDLVKIAARPRGRCPLLGAHRVGVDVLAREALTSLAIRQYGR